MRGEQPNCLHNLLYLVINYAIHGGPKVRQSTIEAIVFEFLFKAKVLIIIHRKM
jgi:hypothetical protein